ncbi:MAG: LysR family transcriptional regulator [Octadecabacter sp.]|nr:LysR family transcriptional regulator [Octadecabacter sp.]
MNFIQRLKPFHLRLIERIAHTGKLQLAADALNVSQPAASRILADVEASVGTTLFERTPKGMAPTQIGHAFLRHARSILTAYENLGTDIDALGKGQSGEVKIGSVTGPAVRCLVPAILKVKKESPQLEPTLEVAPSSVLLRALEQGHFDFVISRMPSGYDSRAFHMLPARSEIVSLVVHLSHPLVDSKRLSLNNLCDFEWAIQERGSPIRTALEDAFANEKTSMPAYITNTSSLLVMLGLLEQSHTIATVVEEVANLLTGGALQGQLRILNLKTQIRVAPYYIIRQRDRQLSRGAERVLEETMRFL